VHQQRDDSLCLCQFRRQGQEHLARVVFHQQRNRSQSSRIGWIRGDQLPRLENRQHPNRILQLLEMRISLRKRFVNRS
jgi:hypothetical protein